ncbi:MAG TPA: PIN domain-containing protein [Thermoprotei archaeon]|nr:PIN domain-containing protein [Thermoprotei archaeon]
MFIVVADTNFLLAPFQFRFNLEYELERVLGGYKIVIPKRVLNELKSLAGMRTRDSIAARNVLEMIEKKGLEIVDFNKNKADDEIIEAAKAFNGIVATNDRELKARALKEGIPCLFVREKKYLVLVYPRSYDI